MLAGPSRLFHFARSGGDFLGKTITSSSMRRRKSTSAMAFKMLPGKQSDFYLSIAASVDLLKILLCKPGIDSMPESSMDCPWAEVLQKHVQKLSDVKHRWLAMSLPLCHDTQCNRSWRVRWDRLNMLQDSGAVIMILPGSGSQA